MVNSNLFGQLVGCNPTSNMVGMVFIIGITPLSDIKMLIMCNTIFNNEEDIGSNPFGHVKSVHSLSAKNIFIVIFMRVSYNG